MPRDPVCGREIDLAEVRAKVGQTLHGAAEVDPGRGTRAFHNGTWYYFCSLDCRIKFLANPESFLKKAGA